MDEQSHKSWIKRTKLLQTEDYWAIWVGFLVIAASVTAFGLGSGLVKNIAVTPGQWSGLGQIGADVGKHWQGYAILFLVFGMIFSWSMRIMGHSLKAFVPGFAVIFFGALAIFYLAAWEVMKKWDLGAPLLALIVGLVIGNCLRLPPWLQTAMRVEYYIKIGIVLLGATLPLTLIYNAGYIAFFQATIVSVVTWLTIYFAATRIFKLEKQFGAVLGAGGAVCGVSASIAVGGAVRAKKDHIAIGIGVVTIWAVVMIFSLTFLCKFIIPEDGVVKPDSPWYMISPGEAGAWVGTSEYADAAGFAVVAEISKDHGDIPICAFTLMKVIGRDIWVGLWAFILSIVSVTFWEKSQSAGRVSVGIIWDRFPKFVLGFFGACVLISLIAASGPEDHIGRAPVQGVYQTKGEKIPYHADFKNYQAPSELAGKFHYDEPKNTIAFQGKMSLEEMCQLSHAATTKDQQTAIRQLQYKSDWEASELTSKTLDPIKKLRDWAFVLCFLCIGLTTRFKDLLTFGMAPFWAFSIGVVVNVPLGYFLSTVVFKNYWRYLGQ